MCSFLGFALWREGLEFPDNIGNLPMAEITREQFERKRSMNPTFKALS
ncbi:hypothetical protein ACNE9Y_31685 [Pseudomonas sp. NY11226]